MNQPILIGTATGRSDHRTNTAQLQQTTTLRMCRADLDPPRADGLLRRTVGPAFRARTTHRHRIGNDDSKQHPVTSGRKADMVPHPLWVASNQSNGRPCRLLNVSALLRFWLLSEASVSAPPLKPIAITITITTPINDRRHTTRATGRVIEKQSSTRIVPITVPMSRCTHPCADVWSSPQHPG